MQATFLPEPELLGCYYDRAAEPGLSVMRLDWKDAGSAIISWNLPGPTLLATPPPDVFGLSIERTDADAYTIHLVWRERRMSWYRLCRREIVESSLRDVLACLGTDLGYLLDQPPRTGPTAYRRAA
jgi:hypothetical protein